MIKGFSGMETQYMLYLVDSKTKKTLPPCNANKLGKFSGQNSSWPLFVSSKPCVAVPPAFDIKICLFCDFPLKSRFGSCGPRSLIFDLH